MKYAFRSFEIDLACRELLENGQQVSLPPKAFSVLVYLIENNDRMVSKRELLEAFWPSNVSDAALLKAISLIRKALEGGTDGEPLVKTHHGHGYRFVASVLHQDEEESDVDLGFNEKRLVSVIRVRVLVNSESGSSSDSESDFYRLARETVDQHDGELIHVLFDGFSAAFGMREAQEDVARRAVNCADNLVRAIGNNAEIAVGVGTGKIALSSTTDEWLPPTGIEKIANALANKAGALEIFIEKNTKRFLDDEVETVVAGDAYKLVSTPKPRSGIPGRPHKSPSKFVGRQSEYAFIESNMDTALAGEGKAIALSGPAGIGKTRIVSELLTNWHPKNCRSVILHCLPGLINTPLSVVKELCNLIGHYVPSIEFKCEEDEALFSELKGERFDSSILKEMSDFERRKRSYAVLKTVLGRASETLPFIIVVEDAHWMDATSREYFTELVRFVHKFAMFIVITTRPTDFPPLVDSVLNVSPLSKVECQDLLSSEKFEKKMDGLALDELISRSQGNPFFLEELAFATQLDDELEEGLPHSVQAVVSMRVGSLHTSYRALIYIISVIGPPADLPLIAHLCNKNVDLINDELNELAKKDFVVFESGGVTFRHILISDVAYSMIGEHDRQQLHTQIAQYYEKLEPKKARPELLAWHHQEGGDIDRALPYWVDASKQALSRSSHQEAVAFCKQGLAVIEGKNSAHREFELDLQLLLAFALTTLDGYSDRAAGDAFLAAQELNKTVRSGKSQVRILVGLWIHNWVLGRLSESLGYAEELMVIAKRAERASLSLQAQASIGQVYMHIGKIPEALAHLEAGLDFVKDELPQTLPEQNAAVSCAAYAAWCAALLGQVDDMHRHYLKSEQFAELQPNPFAKAIHYSLCAESFMTIGDVSMCLDIATKSVELSRPNNFSFWLGTGLVLKGWAHGQRREFDQAFSCLEEGIEVFKATGADVQLANWYGLKAETHLVAEELDKAIAAAECALECANNTDDVYFTPRIHSTLAQTYERRGDVESARTHDKHTESLIAEFGMAPHITLSLTLSSPKPIN